MDSSVSHWLDIGPAATFERAKRGAFAPAVSAEARRRFEHNPAALMAASGMAPDGWQREMLESRHTRALILASRQAGKSLVSGTKAVHKALYTPNALVLLLSPSLRQSQEIFAKVVSLYRNAGEPVTLKSLSALRMELVNGSRIISLPGTERTIRGYSGVDLLVIDEAARVAGDLYFAVRPMLAVSAGELIAISTAWGQRGWFYDEWENGGPDWHRIKITADDCARIPRKFLAEERAAMPDLWFRSEYMCEFCDTIDQLFRSEVIEAMFTDQVQPLFSNAPIAGGLSGEVEPLF